MRASLAWLRGRVPPLDPARRPRSSAKTEVQREDRGRSTTSADCPRADRAFTHAALPTIALMLGFVNSLTIIAVGRGDVATPGDRVMPHSISPGSWGENFSYC